VKVCHHLLGLDALPLAIEKGVGTGLEILEKKRIFCIFRDSNLRTPVTIPTRLGQLWKKRLSWGNSSFSWLYM